jgi:hypothetical protein
LRKLTPNRLPAEAAEALGLAGGTRVLAWSPLMGGGVAAATVDGLHVLTPQGRALHREWALVRQASWEAASGTLAVTWISPRQLTPLELTAPGRFPDVVHERVRASLLLSQEVNVTGGGSVWVALRRSADGGVVTQVVPTAGVRLDDGEIAEQVRRAQEALRDEVGSGFGIVRDADPA